MNIKNKLSSLMYAPLALALLAACSLDDVVENNQPTTQGQTLTINATPLIHYYIRLALNRVQAFFLVPLSPTPNPFAIGSGAICFDS